MTHHNIIVENWRRHINEEMTNTIYLFENNQPKKTNLKKLIKTRNDGKIDNVKLISIINESIEYEAREFLINEGIGDMLKKAGFKMRKKLYTFFYSKAGAYFKSLAGQDKKVNKSVQQHFKKAMKELESGNKKTALKLLGQSGLKTAFKGISVLFKAIKLVIKGLGKIIGVVGKFLKFPPVKIAIIGLLVLSLFKVATITGGMVVAAKIANHTTSLITGKSAVGHAVSKGIDKLKGSDEPEKLNEAEDVLVDIGDLMRIYDAKAIKVAIINLAKELDGKEVFSIQNMEKLQYKNEAGETINYDNFNVEYFDKVLGTQMKTLNALQANLTAIESGASTDTLTAKEDVADLMAASLKAAAMHCKTDPASCEGVDELSSSIKIAWSGTVEASIKHVNVMNQIGDQIESMDLKTDVSSQIGKQVVTGLKESKRKIKVKII